MSETKTLVERLLNLAPANCNCYRCQTITDAAAELTRLQAENEALRHDIERYVAIASEEATRAESLQAENERLTKELKEEKTANDEMRDRAESAERERDAAIEALRELDESERDYHDRMLEADGIPNEKTLGAWDRYKAAKKAARALSEKKS